MILKKGDLVKYAYKAEPDLNGLGIILRCVTFSDNSTCYNIHWQSGRVSLHEKHALEKANK